MSAPTPNTFDARSSVLGSRFVTVQFTAGTAGAAPSSLDRGGEYVSLVTKSTNDYVLSLRSTWYALVNYNVQVIQASFAAAGASRGGVSDETVNDTSAPDITLSFYAGSDGTAVALAAGDVVYATFELTNVKP